MLLKKKKKKKILYIFTNYKRFIYKALKKVLN